METARFAFGVLLVGGTLVAAADAAPRAAIPPAFREALKPGEPFPLSPGWRWTYVRDGKEALFVETHSGWSVDGVETTRLRDVGESSFFTSDALVMAEHGALLRLGSVHEPLPGETVATAELLRNDPPEVLLPVAFKKAHFWRSASKIKEIASSHTFTGTIVDQEMVEVAAGQFLAWRIAYDLDHHSGTGHHLRTWYVPGIGWVRIVKWRESMGGDDSVKRVLDEPIVYELSRIEAIAGARAIKFPTPPVTIQKLPSRVAAPEGELTIFADYDDRWMGGVLVYLVNRTARPTTLSLYSGGFPRLWLETKGANGEWLRVKEQLPWCTDLGEALHLRPGQFSTHLGVLSEKGEVREIRYRLSGFPLASNVGRGVVDPVALRLARYDSLSMKVADLSLVRDVLFDGVELPENEKRSAEAMAIERLENLPREGALEVLERAIASERLLRSHCHVIGATFAKIAPERFEKWVAQLLTDGPPHLRTLVLRHASVLAQGHEGEVAAILLRQLRDPKAPDLPQIMSQLCSANWWPPPEVSDLLAAIAKSENYAEDLRIEAQHERAQRFGTRVFEITHAIEFRDRPNAVPPPVPLVVQLKNTSAKPVTLRYDAPHEIIALYVRTRETYRHESELLKPKPGVTWFAASTRPGRTSVTLAPGASHEVRMKLLDYFVLPPDYDPDRWAIEIEVLCFVPGVHEVPQADGATVNVEVIFSR